MLDEIESVEKEEPKTEEKSKEKKIFSTNFGSFDFMDFLKSTKEPTQKSYFDYIKTFLPSLSVSSILPQFSVINCDPYVYLSKKYVTQYK